MDNAMFGPRVAVPSAQLPVSDGAIGHQRRLTLIIQAALEG